MSRKFKVAVIGCGSSLNMYSGISLPNSQWELVGFADPTREAIAAAEKEWGGYRGFDSIESLMSSGIHADIAIVCTPPHTHLPIAETLARHGVNILMQKPLARTPEEGGSILEFCHRSGVSIRVSFQKRYLEAFQFFHTWIIGKDRGGHLNIKWHSKSGCTRRTTKHWKEELVTLGGVLADLGPHIVDTSSWWLGEIEKGDAEIAFGMFGKLENVASGLLRHRFGGATLFNISNIESKDEESYSYTCSEGSISLIRQGMGLHADWLVKLCEYGLQHDRLFIGSPNPFLLELGDFCHSVETGNHGNGRNGLGNLEKIASLYGRAGNDSIDTWKSETLELFFEELRQEKIRKRGKVLS